MLLKAALLRSFETQGLQWTVRKQETLHRLYYTTVYGIMHSLSSVGLFDRRDFLTNLFRVILIVRFVEFTIALEFFYFSYIGMND